MSCLNASSSARHFLMFSTSDKTFARCDLSRSVPVCGLLSRKLSNVVNFLLKIKIQFTAQVWWNECDKLKQTAQNQEKDYLLTPL